MALPRLLEIKDEIAALEVTKATLKAENERLQRENGDLAESNTELRKRSGFSPTEYKQVEKEHLATVDELDAKTSTLLKTESEVDKRLEEKCKRLSDLSAAIADLEERKAIIEQALPALAQEREDAEKATNEAKEALKTQQEGRRATITALDEEITLKRRELREIVISSENRLEEVRNEEALLSIKRSDLNIYEKRLREKYPDETIIV